jgi:hypothetical protein
MKCSICGNGKHFMKDCKRLSLSNKQYISSIKPEANNNYLLPDKLGVYIEYLRANGRDFDITLDECRILVEQHLKKSGRILVNPISAPYTPVCGCTRCSKNI